MMTDRAVLQQLRVDGRLRIDIRSDAIDRTRTLTAVFVEQPHIFQGDASLGDYWLDGRQIGFRDVRSAVPPCHDDSANHTIFRHDGNEQLALMRGRLTDRGGDPGVVHGIRREDRALSSGALRVKGVLNDREPKRPQGLQTARGKAITLQRNEPLSILIEQVTSHAVGIQRTCDAAKEMPYERADVER